MVGNGTAEATVRTLPSPRKARFRGRLARASYLRPVPLPGKFHELRGPVAGRASPGAACRRAAAICAHLSSQCVQDYLSYTCHI